MDISNLNKNIFLIFLVSFFLFSCVDDKDKNCTYMNLRPYIRISNFKPTDNEITEAYLLVYTNNGFFKKIDSTIPNNIINHHKRNNSKNEVNFKFDEMKMNTGYNYILVTNQKKKYMISDYTFKQVSRKMMFKTKKLCEVDSIKVNNTYIKFGGTLKLNKNLGISLK